MSRRCALLLLVWLPATISLAETPALQPGVYEVRMRTQFDDVSQAVPTNVVQRCVTDTEIAQPARLAPQFSVTTTCNMSDYAVEENSATWVLHCTGEADMQGQASVRWERDSFAGTTELSLQRTDAQMRMRQSYSAKRIGDC